VGSVLWVVSVLVPEQRLNLRPVPCSYGPAVGQGSLCGLLVVFNLRKHEVGLALGLIRPAALMPEFMLGPLTLICAAPLISPADHVV